MAMDQSDVKALRSDALGPAEIEAKAETLAVGTRTAEPSIRPAISGRTRSSSLCAEVVVGTMESAAARLRAKSAAGASTVGWLPV